ncbi:hypothetical protein [Granulicella sp. S156]|uniref:hypothetical protein n=1 Tax=Granulicella sp. S156 TaxID=1747224 RepID=UPI00131BD759|nr:hypothetical protein [Granulicella sp. S156]
MNDPNIIAGYPIVRGDDGQLYYVAYTDHGGQAYGWLVTYIDHLRHHHAHHAHARRAPHPAHHHASHHSKHHGAVALNHRRTVHPKPHHAANAQPAIASSNGSDPPQIAAEAAAATAEWKERSNALYARRMMHIQGGLDLAAGGSGLAVTIGALAIAGAPETLGASIVVGFLTYSLIRALMQIGEGAAESAASFSDSDEQLKETAEDMEKMKTVTSVLGDISLLTDKVRGDRAHWTRAGVIADGETLADGFLIRDPFEEVGALNRIASTISPGRAESLAMGFKYGLKSGDIADKFDKTHFASDDTFKVIAYLEQERKAKERARENARKQTKNATQPTAVPR